jgi:hypothetical protein
MNLSRACIAPGKTLQLELRELERPLVQLQDVRRHRGRGHRPRDRVKASYYTSTVMATYTSGGSSY